MTFSSENLAFTLKPRAFETYELPVDVQDNPDDAVLQVRPLHVLPFRGKAFIW